ncbi:MAG: ROK family protein, partial [Anaerolineae bacterium]
EALRSRLQAPVYLDNDANLAALGEWQHGAGRGHDDMVYITVSTGIGGGVISEGRLLHGARGLGAEIGHIRVLPGGPKCSCGQYGHLEAVASGPAIVRWVQSELRKGGASALQAHPPQTAAQVAEAARQGDALAQEAFRRAGEFLAQGIADLLHIFNPSAVVIGGGVAQSADLFLPTVQTSLPTLVMDAHFVHELVLTTAQLGDNAGLTGALALARQHA